MRLKFIIQLLIFTTCFVCYSQEDLMNIDTNPSITTGKYYKDINNSLDKYVGIWKFLDGNKIFTIEFQKQTNVNFDNYQMDKIVGNYSYQVNGVMEVNTLNNSIT